MPLKQAILRLLAVLTLAASIALIDAGRLEAHEVCLHNAAEDYEFLGFYAFEVVSELDLLVDSTFSGVVRKDGRLWSTYDRSVPATGKRACPT